MDVGQDGLAIFVYCEQEVSLGRKTYPRDILSVGKGQSVRLVAVRTWSAKCRVASIKSSMGGKCGILYEVEDRHPVSYGREEMRAIWVE